MPSFKILKVMQVMMDKAKYVIKWPSKEDYDDITAKFNKPSVRYMYINFFLYMQFEVFGKNSLFLVSLMSAALYQEIPKCHWCHRWLPHQDSSKSS